MKICRLVVLRVQVTTYPHTHKLLHIHIHTKIHTHRTTHNRTYTHILSYFTHKQHTHTRTCLDTHTHEPQNTLKKVGQDNDDDCFYYHSWRNNVVIAFGTIRETKSSTRWRKLQAQRLRVEKMANIRHGFGRG